MSTTKRSTSIACKIFLVGWFVGCMDSGSADREPTEAELQAQVLDAFAEPRPMDRMQKLVSAMQHLNPENVEAVSRLYEQYVEGLRQVEMQPFYDAWTRFDGLSAYEFSESVPFPLQGDIAREAVITAWTVNDFISARVVIEQAMQTRPRLADKIVHAFVRGWAIAGHEGLSDFILRLEDPGPVVLAALPQIYQRAGGDYLMEWSTDIINRSSERITKMKTFRMTVRSVAFRDPRSAIPFVMEHYNSGEDYAVAGPRVLADNWLRTDPEGALNWLKFELEAPDEVRAEALGLAVGSWLHFNRAEARQWLDSLPTGDPYYQPAFDTMAKRIAARSPEDAIHWCNRGGIGEVNRNCLRPVAIEWYKKDPVAAGRWMEEESGLPLEDLNTIRQQGSPRGR